MGNQPTTLIDSNQPINSYNKKSTLDLFSKRLSLNKLNKFSKKSKKKGGYYAVPPNAERPSAPSCPEVFQDQDQYFILRWDPPAYDGGVPIMGYVIQHLELGLPQLDSQDQDDTEAWYSSEPGQITQTECILNNLVPGTTYQFRVLAENLIGYSQPSDISDPIVFNPHGELDDWFFAPTFTMRLDENYTVMEHEMLTMSVEVVGQPYPQVRWIDKHDQDLSKLNSKKYKTRSSGLTRTLIINSVELSDAGYIKCVVINKEGMTECTSNLNVEAPPRIKRVQSPEFLQNPYDVNEKEEERLTAIEDDYEDLIFQAGELVRLKFLYSGSPKPIVQLIHNGETATDPRIITEFTEKVITVKIENILRCDRGEWLVKLENVLGEDCTSVLITITDHPSPPGKPEILQLSDNTCILRWDEPLDDGGCPIHNYIVEYFRSEWGVWLKALTNKTPTAKIKDLIPGSKYSFRVKAENLYGVSEPSEESVEILITDLPSTRNTITGENGGLMTTVEESIEEEEDTLLKPAERGVPPNAPPRPTTKKPSPRRSPFNESPQPPTIHIEKPEGNTLELPVRKATEVKAADSSEEPKKLYSRSDLIKSAVTSSVNYVQRFLDETIGPMGDEVEKVVKLESATSIEDDEEFEYDFDKLQKEYEEEMMRLRKELHEDEDDEDSEDYEDDDFEKIDQINLETNETVVEDIDKGAELEKQKLDAEMKEKFEKMKREWEEEDKMRLSQLQEQKTAPTPKVEPEHEIQIKKQEKIENAEVDRIKREIAQREEAELEAELQREANLQLEAADKREGEKLKREQEAERQKKLETEKRDAEEREEMKKWEAEARELSERRVIDRKCESEGEGDDDWRTGYSARRRGMRSEEKSLQSNKKVFLPDKFTDYLTMKVASRDRKIGSSLRSLNSSNESSNKSINQSRENLRRMLDFDDDEPSKQQPSWQSNPDVNKIKPLNESKIRDRSSPLSASVKASFKPAEAHNVIDSSMKNQVEGEEKVNDDGDGKCYVKHASYVDEEENEKAWKKVFSTSTATTSTKVTSGETSKDATEDFPEKPPKETEEEEKVEIKKSGISKSYLIVLPLFFIDIYLTLIAIVLLLLWNKYKSS